MLIVWGSFNKLIEIKKTKKGKTVFIKKDIWSAVQEYNGYSVIIG